MSRAQRKSLVTRAPETAASAMELPDFDARFAELPGGQETNQRFQLWWDMVRQRLEFDRTSTSDRFRQVKETVNGLTASVTEIIEVNASQDEYLEARWTMEAAAGPVVTGMTLYSASGPDTNVSYIAFRADRFQVNTSSGNKQLFSATATDVKLGDVLTVDLLNRKIFIGVGTYANSNTSFYVDDLGRFSLKDRFTWDGTDLALDGNVVLSSGHHVRSGQTAYNTGTGFFLGNDAGTPKLSVGVSTGNRFTWDGSIVTLQSDAVYIGMSKETTVGVGTLSQINGPIELFDFGGGSFSSGNIFARLVGGTQSSKSVALAGSNFGMNGRVWDTTTYQDFGRFSITTLNDAGVNRASFFSLYVKNTSNVNQYLQFNQDGRLTVGGQSLVSGRINLDGAGTTAADGIYFNSDTTLYRGAAGVLATGGAFVAGGAIGTTARFEAGDGSTGSPAYGFTSDPDTGWRLNSAGDMRGVTSGTDRIVIRDAAIVCLVPLKLDNSYVAGAPAATGYVTIQDFAGTTYRIPVAV